MGTDNALPATADVLAGENPLKLSYWLGQTDPRPLALFRILFGLALCHDLFNYAHDLRAFITDEGMLPRGIQAAPRVWSLFDLTGDPTAVSVLFAIGCSFVVSFTLGYQARISALLAWLFLTSLHTRNLYVTDGGDDLARNLMFLSIFGDLAGCWSLDNRFGRRRRFVPVLVLRFMQLHIVLLYFVAARLKFRAGWLTKNIIFQALQLTGFTRPPALWLMQSPLFCRLSTLMTLGMEWAFAFCALAPIRVGLFRALAIACGAGVQLAILLTMRVGIFTETMLASMALFTRPEWFDWLGAKLGRDLALTELTPPAASLPATERALLRSAGAAQLVLAGFLSFNFVTMAWGPFAARRFPLPSWTAIEHQWLWLDQPMGLFDIVYEVPSWRADGVTTDGRHVEVLPSAIPDLVPVVRWRFSRWYKFTFKERERPFRFAALADFACRSYAEHAGHSLREVTFFETRTPPRLPDGSALPARTLERWHQQCSPSAVQIAQKFE